MAKAIRDSAQLRNNLLATVKAAGTAGMPLKSALVGAVGREPLGADYTLALNLRKEKQIFAYPSEGGSLWIVHKDFHNGKAPANLGDKPAVEPKPVPVKRRTRQHKPPSASLLLTIQYGHKESVTLSYEQARQIYRQLAGVFGDE